MNGIAILRSCKAIKLKFSIDPLAGASKTVCPRGTDVLESKLKAPVAQLDRESVFYVDANSIQVIAPVALTSFERAVVVAFELSQNVEPVTKLIEKYSVVPMSLADACFVRMTETLADPSS